MNGFDERSAKIEDDLRKMPHDALPTFGFMVLGWLARGFEFGNVHPQGNRVLASKPVFPQWAVILDLLPGNDDGGIWCRLRMEGPDRTKHAVDVLWWMDVVRGTIECRSFKAGKTALYREGLDEGVKALAVWERTAIAVPQRLVEDGWLLDRVDVLKLGAWKPE